MSRADAYGAYYRESRPRLLHQVYAFCGNTEVARRAVADAFVSAAHHWRKIAEVPDRDAWVRERAFSATRRAQNRARKPWYESAMSTADQHRATIGALSALAPTDRTLVILHFLAGVDLLHAGHEAGLTDAAAAASLDASLAAMAGAGIDVEPTALKAALDDLRLDLVDEPMDDPNRLRREGNRRRRSHLLLAGVTSLALVVGAGALTATQTPASETGGSILLPGNTQPTTPPADEFSTDDLATVATVSTLDDSRRWKIGLTTSDFGADQPASACLSAGPTGKTAEHYWLRQFSSGSSDDPTQATQSLEVQKSPEAADRAYGKLVQEAATCRDASRQIEEYKTVDGLGDAASMFDYRYVVGPTVREEWLTLVRTGTVVMVWVVRPTTNHPITSRQVLKMVGDTIDGVCVKSDGHCSDPPFNATAQTPPPVPGAAGFLSPVDLPVFAGLAQPWVATAPRPAPGNNPSATDCDNADFNAAGAQSVTARTFVIPDAPQLADIFGMSETTGAFAGETAAKAFVSSVVRSVSACEKKQLNATVANPIDLSDGPVRGKTWQIQLSTSENRVFVLRMAIIRVGATVAQLTFTPSANYDLTAAQFAGLADRAARRLQQG